MTASGIVAGDTDGLQDTDGFSLAQISSARGSVYHHSVWKVERAENKHKDDLFEKTKALCIIVKESKAGSRAEANKGCSHQTAWFGCGESSRLLDM